MESEQTPEYAVAYDCGHRTFTTHGYHAGIAWCVLCGHHVGVIIQRIDPAPANVERPLLDFATKPEAAGRGRMGEL